MVQRRIKPARVLPRPGEPGGKFVRSCLGMLSRRCVSVSARSQLRRDGLTHTSGVAVSDMSLG